MSTKNQTFGIIILAAGNSSRLGQPKQLLKFNGKSLLRHTIDEAVNVVGNKVMVVTGADKDLVEEELHHLPVNVIHNKFWQEGMSSSIYTGIITLIKIFPQLNHVILSVCDQPFISADLFTKMILLQKNTKKGIVAAAYANTIGVPVLFSDKYVEELIALKGQEGAKKILNKFPDDLITINFPKGEVDIDTIEDQINITHQVPSIH